MASPQVRQLIPYWRLSGFYFVYFASLGALLPYWGLYLRSIGLDAIAIGTLMGVLMATKIVAPNIWGWLADRGGRPIAIVRLAAFAAMLAFSGVLMNPGFGGLVVLVTTFGFFWNACLPQVEATTLSHLGAEHQRYSRVRLWGSVGFMVTVIGLGGLVDAIGIEVLPPVTLLLFFSIWLTSLLVPERSLPRDQKGHESVLTVLRRKEVSALLAVCFLMQFGHAPYYVFFSIYLQDHGYEVALIGGLWALGVLAEVVTFVVMHIALRSFGPRRLLLATLLLAALRWLLIAGFVEHVALLVMAQLLHAMTYGVFHASAIHLIHHHFRGRTQVRGQALYGSLTFGAGGAIGSYAAGVLWDAAGPQITFGVAAVVSALALSIGWRYLHVPAH